MPQSPEDRTEVVRGIAESLREERGALMPVLHAVMAEFGHIARDDVVAVADVLNLSIADVHGVVSFYEDFRTSPPPTHSVRICRGEACQSVGSEALLDRAVVESLERAGDVEVGQVFCLGNCALGPSAMVDGRLVGRVTAERLRSMAAGWTS